MGKLLMSSIVVLFFLFPVQKPKKALKTTEPAPLEISKAEVWADSVFSTLSAEERLGQLFMVRAHSDKGPKHVKHIDSLVKKYHIGGLCFFQGTPEKQAELLNRYQGAAKIPLMVSMDAEWGLGMRMKQSTISFPQQLTLGAIQNNHLLYDMGKEIARQLRRVGTHVNFAPVVDINNNPKNPVINTRSFGEDRLNVAVKSYMYMQGMQDNEVMACAKHFPGHGDTDVDSHHDLPVLNHDRKRLDSIEMFPFKVLSNYGVGSMMIAHLHVPNIDDEAHVPTTLSKKAVTGILKEEIGYDGLIFTDGLGMKGVSKHFPNGEIEVRALMAGDDILLLPQDVKRSLGKIKEAIAEGRLNQNQLDQQVKRVLKAKYNLGLTKPQQIEVENVREDLNSPYAKALKRKLISNALTLVKNKDDLIPFQTISHLKLASLSIGATSKTTFQKTLSKYGNFAHYQAKKNIYSDEKRELLKQLEDKDLVVIGLHDMNKYEKNNFGLSQSQIDFVNELSLTKQVVLTVFGNPYCLKYFENVDWLLEAYEENSDTEDLAAQGLFGAFGFQGRLPVTASELIKYNDGINTTAVFRIGYGLPEEVGLNSDILSHIDTIAQEAIEDKATPGCAVLVAKDGKIVFQKSYGHHTYKKKISVLNEDLYDLASITKVASTTLAMMKLSDMGLIQIENPIGDYINELDTTNKKELPIRDIMTHRAGLVSWIPFYKKTLTKSRRNPKPSTAFYRNAPSMNFSIPVASNLYLKNDYKNAIWDEILASTVYETKKYRYSDLGFYMLSELVNRITNQRLDDFVETQFYERLGLQTMTYNPLTKFDHYRIVPSEEDRYFRRQKVQGFVHDMGAAMLGGVSGHAGLFSNTNDLAVIFQMLLNDGYYAGVQYLSPETIEKFTTRCDECTRRGIGFDMKQTNHKKNPNLPEAASVNSFGHIGFTGTCAWADPDNDLVFIFLSNRTYPSMRNHKLIDDNIRGRIHEVVYEAIQ